MFSCSGESERLRYVCTFDAVFRKTDSASYRAYTHNFIHHRMVDNRGNSRLVYTLQAIVAGCDSYRRGNDRSDSRGDDRPVYTHYWLHSTQVEWREKFF